MPAFAVPQSGGNAIPALNITSVMPGDGIYYLFAAETYANPPQASVVFERTPGPSVLADGGTTFQVQFAAPPVAVVLILGSNNPNLEVFNLNDWIPLFTSTDHQSDGYTDTNRYKYYCAYLLSQASGGALTVTAQR